MGDGGGGSLEGDWLLKQTKRVAGFKGSASSDKTPPADESALLSAASFPLGTFLEKLDDVISEGRDES